MEYILITNDCELAEYAQECGVHRIMIDLEILGKKTRQGHLNTLISGHSIDDVQKIRKVLKKSRLQVRVNPINENSKSEIDNVIDYGADILLLPMYTSHLEVKKFIEYVNGRATVKLLLETPQALVRIDDVLELKGVDEIYVGLNDLHLGLGLNFIFEILSGGIIEYLSNKLANTKIKFGFGGIARLGQGLVDSSMILAEHYRLNSQMVILSRDFHSHSKNLSEFTKVMNLKEEIKKIDEFTADLVNKDELYFMNNKKILKEKIDSIVIPNLSKINYIQ